MREIVLDTETTGLDPNDGHRVVEIACIELWNHLPSGKFFHTYLNPERDMPEGALAVHGLTEEFLKPQPLFSAMAQAMLDFISDTPLIIHNAGFDLAFLNAELKRAGLGKIACPIVDTLTMARQKYPGSPASLDALCKRFAIDLSAREKHGARLDGELLAAVYLELIGGRQPGLELANLAQAAASVATVITERPARAPRLFAPSTDELARHAALLAKLKSPLWQS